MSKELLEMIKLEKAKVYALDINIGELHTNFEICLEDFENNRDQEKASRTYKHCKMNDISESDILTYITELEDILKEQYKIEPETVPDHDELKKYQIDENELYDFIDNTYQELNIIRDIEEIDKKEKEHLKASSDTEKKNKRESKEKNKDKERENNTIWRDVYSLSGVYRMREGVVPRTLKDSKAIFITTNSSLALASRRFEIKEHSTKNSIPSCITDYFLGTLIWLNTPGKAEEITKKKLIADCYALTRPDEELIKAYLIEVDKLKKVNKINSEQHILLRTYQGAYNILNSRTYGDAREFTSDMPYEILEQIINDMEREAASKVQKQIDEKDTQLKNEREVREKVEREHQNIIGELKNSHRREEILRRNSERIARFIVFTGVFGITALLFWFSYHIQVKEGFEIKWINWLARVLLIIVGLANIVLGFSIVSFVPKITIRFRNFIIRQFTKE